MTPLAAARRLAETGPDDGGRDGEYEPRCIYCGAECVQRPPTAYAPGHVAAPHVSGCPWLAMPQIVEALERLEARS